MKKFIIIGTLIVVGLAIVFGLSLIPTSVVEVPSSAEHSFTIETPFKRVRKILVRTNSVKKIVAMADAKLIDQKWLDTDFQIERPILDRNWDLQGEGNLKVEFNDSYLGRHEMTLDQTVHIQPAKLVSENTLAHPSGPVEAYTSRLEAVPDENGNAKFNLSLDLKIKTKANWLIRQRVVDGIRESAGESLKKQEQAIRDIVEQHGGDLIILPEK